MLAKLKKQFVLQHGQSDCGAACLASIINYYGGNSPLDKIRRITGTTKTGTKLLGLYQGAKALGFDVAGMEAKSIENLKELTNPAILSVVLENRLQHYVIFYGFAENQLIIGDPAKGISFWKSEKINKVWRTKSLLKLTPNETFVKSQTKPNKYRNLIKWVKEDINILLASLFLGILIAFFSLATAIFSQKLIDVILPTQEVTKLIVGLTLFAFVLLIKSGLSYIRSTFLISQSQGFNNRMIGSFFKSLLTLSKSFFDAKKTGEMIARMNDTRRIQSAISNLFGNLLIEALVIIVSLMGVFIYAWQIGIVVAFFLPVYLLILWQLNNPIINAQKEVMEAYATNESNYIDVITGIAEVKSTGTTTLFHKSTIHLYRLFQQQIFNLGKIQVQFNLRTEFVGILLMVSVISGASFMVLQNQLLLGAMMAVLTLSASIGPSLTRMALFNIQLQEAKVAFNRMEEFTELEGEQNSGNQLKEIQTLVVKNMSFNFPGSLPLLKEINLTIKKGSITTLLGESGAGESTIIQLFQRFYTPTLGEILIDKKSVDVFELESFRKQIGVVPQEVKIFNNYLFFNIALSENPKELEEVVSWCEKNGFAQFFLNFPQGYMTLLGEEGANISGGQKQLVGLARALYRKPQVLLIDEGTSAMDRKTEQFILHIIQKVKQDTAVLMVTHRMKVASASDYVYILENGKITQQGM